MLEAVGQVSETASQPGPAAVFGAVPLSTPTAAGCLLLQLLAPLVVGLVFLPEVLRALVASGVVVASLPIQLSFAAKPPEW